MIDSSEEKELRTKKGTEMYPSVRDALKIEAVRQKRPFWILLDEAVRSYLGETPAETKALTQFNESVPIGKIPKNAHDKLLKAQELLKAIFDKGTAEQQDWITGNLVTFVEAIGRRPPAPSTSADTAKASKLKARSKGRRKSEVRTFGA